MDEERFRPGAASSGSASRIIYRKKCNAGVDAPQSWQTEEGGQEGQPDAAARPGCAGGIPAGGKRLAGAYQSSAAPAHATSPGAGVGRGGGAYRPGQLWAGDREPAFGFEPEVVLSHRNPAGESGKPLDIGSWLRGLGLERYETAFRDNDAAGADGR